MYYAEKNGEPTKYNLMRGDRQSVKYQLFAERIYLCAQKQGYIVNLNPDLKYATIRSVNDTRNTRLYRLGEKYDKEHIFQTLKENDFGKLLPNLTHSKNQ